MRLVFSGHVLNEGAARRTDVRPDGTPVHQMLANYQHRQEGGASFLRIVSFEDGATRARVRTWAPSLGVARPGPAEEFTLDLGRR